MAHFRGYYDYIFNQNTITLHCYIGSISNEKCRISHNNSALFWRGGCLFDLQLRCISMQTLVIQRNTAIAPISLNFRLRGKNFAQLALSEIRVQNSYANIVMRRGLLGKPTSCISLFRKHEARIHNYGVLNPNLCSFALSL